MNVIGQISKGSTIFKKCPDAIPLLCFLLTKVGVEETILFSSHLDEDIEKVFNNTEQLEVLEEMGYIKKLPDNYYQVGTYVEGKRYLLCNILKTEKFTLERVKIKELFDSYKKVCIKTGKQYRLRELKENIVNFFAKEWPQYTLQDLLVFFSTVYELSFQEVARPFQKKEYGQMKNLFSLYEQDVLTKMIFYYVNNSTEFSQSVPTVGLLLYHKDDIFTKALKKSATKVLRDKLREETVDETF